MLREKFDLSQQELGDRLGINRVLISNYENADRPVPTVDLERIANWFHIELGDLFEENLEEFNFNTAFAFRSEGLTTQDFQSLGNFKEIFSDYCRMKELVEEHGV